MSDNIKVVVKVRPLISRELEDKQHHQWRVQSNTLYQLDSNGRDFGQAFTFDKVYSEDTKTSDVYNDVAKPIVEAATAGFNGTIFAYGQTSSGKTYTMTGTETSRGIIPLSVLNLFEIIKSIPDRDFLVRVSYLEIYNETLKDLLDVKKENIKIHETYEGCIKVDATEKVTSSPEEVLDVMREGEVNRQTGATNMNEKSSRSHSIFQITIESREHIEGTEGSGCVNVSQLNLVDLAGSERAGQTGATGIRFKEGTHINKSLSALALVIKQLSEDPNKYVNYRDSKLTRILQNSLGGNAKTSIICAITPVALEETISTLQFATRAKAIKNKPEVNAVVTADATMIQSLTKQLCRLQSQLETKKNLEVILENKKNVEQDLQKQIANLQKLILNGFSQRSSIDQIGGARRKQPPRRITISTLSVRPLDEEPIPEIPKFCTPTLKYNPMVIPNPSDFVPVQSSSKLASLPEEPTGLITPPPNDKNVNFSEEVIEIDSDDDNNSTIPTCSPYHKCYSVSKTPPCVLRKNCHRAEKNYREIVEFTEREKIYKPDVVELMEKLELSTNMTAKLQDEIEILKKNSKEKDLEMEHLLFKIRKTEEDVKNAKMELKAHSQEFNTKLTDCEVSYDILKKKAKLREEELLSLLEEQKLKKCDDISKLPPTPGEKEPSFMDMSKDISLVNSDNESSITTSNEEESSKTKKFVTNLQEQLISKCQTIVQLEANIASQKQSIEYLEQSSHELQILVDSFNEKNTYLENENRLYKSNVDALNDTLKDQKENLKTAQNDIASYNHIIQELQQKLTKKYNSLDMSISDSVLENMIANEEKVIANNENMKNIIHSFKIALDNRNTEIKQLKLSIKQTETTENNSLNDDIKEKINQINELNVEIAKLKDTVNNNIVTINNLVREKSNLTCAEEGLVKKITELENQKKDLTEMNKNSILRISELNETNNNLLQSLSDKNSKNQEYLQLNSELQSKLDEMSLKITQIDEELNAKNNMISSLNEINNDKQEYENHAKSALDKLKSVISILNGDVQEVPEFIENCVTLFNALSNGLCLLENVATDTVSEKSVATNENSQLKTEILNLHKKFEVEKTTLLYEIDALKQKIENHLQEISDLRESNEKICDGIISEYQEKITTKIFEYNTLLAQCNNIKDNSIKLSEELLQKQEIISSLNKMVSDCKLKIEDLEAQIQYTNIALKTEQDQSKSQADILLKRQDTFEELNNELTHKHKELVTLEEKTLHLKQVQDEEIENIFNRLCDISNSLNIEISNSFEDTNRSDCIFLLIDQIKNEVINHENIIKCELVETRNSIETLLNTNQHLNNKLSKVENENKALCNELENNNLDIESLSKNLIESNILLEQLKKDLENKALEIQVMEHKAEECKDQFTNLDILMNQRMQDLRYENEMLKTRYCNEEQIQKASFSEKSHDLNKSVRAVCENKQPSFTTITPPSLLTICCNKIVDTMEPKQNDYNLSSPSSSDTQINKAKCATCDNMSIELRILDHEKCSLLGILEQSERKNKELLFEQENIRQELQLLLEPAEELQKKISSHKTNLSILTATTYAENRSLKSQVLALEHHHRKLLNVCQGDIPEFKKQLRDLFVILKGDPVISDNQNTSLKRYSLPDVLDNNITVSNFKNESSLDGDLLMLDTNITLTTTGDNTLGYGDNTIVGYDQTSLDLTQTMFKEEPCQSNYPNGIEANNIHSQISLLESDSQNMSTSLEVLKQENCKLKALVDKVSVVTEPKVDVHNSPLKAYVCTKCQIDNEKSVNADIGEVKRLTKKLEDIQNENQNIVKKYEDLIQEMPRTDALVSKLEFFKQEHDHISNELIKLNSTLNIKNKELKRLQEENDTLSTQVMENISEADDLNKELTRIKTENFELTDKIRKMESTVQVESFECPQLPSSVNESTTLLNPNRESSPHAKLNRSLSDSETSSRFNKICTLQSELYAGREDCKVLTEHVATIKQHLNCSVSMDLDESMGDSILSQQKNFVTTNSQHTISSMPDIKEEQPLDSYTVDKVDCYNYYLEITGDEKGNLSDGMKIIDILKMFYNSLLERHGNEVEDLANKVKNYEESQKMLQTQTDTMTSKYSAISKTLEEKEENLIRLSKFMSQLKYNINRVNNEFSNKDNEDLKVVNMFKQNFLCTLDYEVGISSASVFEKIIAKCQGEVNYFKEQCAILEHKKSSTDIEHCLVEELKGKLTEKESEHNLLKAKKEKLLEISSAVTLDIVRKEQEIHRTLNEGCQKLLQHELITSDLALSESARNNIDIIIDHVIKQSKLKNNKQHQNEIETLSLEINKSKNIIYEKEKELDELKTQVQSLRDINNNVTTKLTDVELKFMSLKEAHEQLNKSYDCKIQENIKKMDEIDKLTEEISSLRETVNNKELLISSLSDKNAKTTVLLDSVRELKEANAKLTEEISSLREMLKNKEILISSLSEKKAKTSELLLSIRELQDDNNKLKSVNQMISKENESHGVVLQKSNETIKQNIIEMGKMTSDILILRESVKDATCTIESLKQEVRKLTVVNAELKLSLEEKKRQCVRLEMNIKTHDKTAELQSKMITRLNKQKEEDDRMICENQSKINEVNEMFNSLQGECEKLKTAKESLEARVSELQEAVERPRASLDAADSSRRRRQSIHDSKRLLGDLDEQRDLDAVFESRQKHDDLFSEGDDTSGRSTPFGLGKGHDSLLSRTEQSDKDGDHSSRPSSVQAARLRRQSIHDLHRGVARHTPSPHDLSSRINDELSLRDSSGNKSDSGEVSGLRGQLTSCQQELEELKERYRELDEECETCAEYLRERDAQCAKLKKEKATLEKQIMELKLSNRSSNEKPSVAHVAVNTDEDWANLHAVVVDRMSYDAEVDKNKRLTKTIEELRFQKQDLRNTIGKMQKALEKQHSSKDNRELEATKEELKSVQEELEDLKVKYKELDEECETCAEFLKEREEQCRRLKEAKAALESKLQEYQEDSQELPHYSVRKKRQNVHDKNRNSVMDQTDASTETNEDLLSNQVEHDDSSQNKTDVKQREIKRLKMIVDKLVHQKAALEQQLRGAHASPAPQPMYVATGSAIVQNQQLTDVMKENQRLKKMNAKLVNICKKRGKSDAIKENEDPCEQG